MVPFFVNDVLLSSGKHYRLLRFAKHRLLPQTLRTPEDRRTEAANGPTGAYVICLDENKPLPVFWTLERFGQAVAKGEATTPPSSRTRPVKDSEADVAVRDLRWRRIESLVEDERIWEKEPRGALLRAFSEGVGVSRETLLDNLRRWWTGGQVKDSLLGNLFNSGYVDETSSGAQVFRTKSEKGEEIVVFAPPKQKARGRSRKDNVRPFAFSAKLRRVILKIAQRHYLEDYSKSVASASVKVLARLFCERDENKQPLRDGKGRIILKPPGQRPSKAQIRYLLKKCVSHSVAYAKRHGRAEYENNHKPRPGSVRDDAVGAGDVYEIDSTPADDRLVSRANPAKIVGKPTIYLVVDRRTRLVVGFLVTLENPSWSEAALAIMSIASNWKKLCDKFGIPYDERDWPAEGRLPNSRFVADRADMITADSEGLTDAVGRAITNAEALMSANKSIVEIRNKILQLPFRYHVPGHEPSENHRKRRGKKYHKDACLTLEQYVGLLLHAIWLHNTTAMVDYEATPEEAMSDITLSPVNLWHFHAKRMGAAARLPLEAMRRKLLPKGKGLVKNDGIHFRHCVYYCDDIREWMVTASVAGAFEVDVSFDSNLVNKVIVYDKTDARKSFPVPLAPKCAELENWTFQEVEQLHAKRLDRRRKAVEEKEASDVTMLHAIDEVVEPALAQMREKSRGLPLGRRVSQGRVERVVEGMERRAQSHDVSAPVDPYGIDHQPPARQDHAPDPEEPLQQAPQEESAWEAPRRHRPRVAVASAPTLDQVVDGSVESV